MKEENSASLGYDIFECSNFRCLETGISKIMTYEDGKLKYGKKQKLLHSLLNGGKILLANLLIKHKYPEADKLIKYLDIVYLLVPLTCTTSLPIRSSSAYFSKSHNETSKAGTS